MDPEAAVTAEREDQRSEVDRGTDRPVRWNRDGLEDEAGTAMGQGLCGGEGLL
ncbi:hypothetical protein [Bacteroides caecimuris]|uniref:hypothetical protein n=1 Tax=Bacteroides caecimuris TaxID=1796613 RepID=UPI0025728050|nr:hypothetical protein [Bacteroides caecimuris]